MRLCCDPRWYHGQLRHTCKAKNGQSYSGTRRETDRLREQHRVEDARAGIVQVWNMATGTFTVPKRDECSWHQDQGVEFTTSGICTGPACIAYRDAHLDDRVDV